MRLMDTDKRLFLYEESCFRLNEYAEKNRCFLILFFYNYFAIICQGASILELFYDGYEQCATNNP